MKKSKNAPKRAKGEASPSALIDARTRELGDWRGETLARVRRLIKEANLDVVEEVKWRKPSNAMLGVPVWEHDGIICTGETCQAVVKLTFARGAALKENALKTLIRAARRGAQQVEANDRAPRSRSGAAQARLRP